MRARDWREAWAADRRRCWQRLGTEDSRQLCAGAGFLQVQSPVHIKDQQRQIKPSRVKWKVVHVKTISASIQNHKKSEQMLIGLYANFIINRHRENWWWYKRSFDASVDEEREQVLDFCHVKTNYETTINIQFSRFSTIHRITWKADKMLLFMNNHG